MADILIIPKSNVLTFSRYNTDRPTLDNRLLQDDTRIWRKDKEYYTQFDITGNIAFQFISNRPIASFTYEMFEYGEDTTPIIGLTITKEYDIDDFIKVYENRFSITALQAFLHRSLIGKFYFKLTVGTYNGYPEMVYYSEYIQIDDYSATEKKLLQWSGSENDGIYYADTNTISFECMVDLNLDENYIETESKVFSGYSGDTYNLSSKHKRLVNCYSLPVPSYFADKLTLAFAHQNIYINGQQFVMSEDGSKKTQIKQSNIYDFSVILIDANFENYYNFIALDNEQEISTRRLKISDTGLLKISDNGYLKI